MKKLPLGKVPIDTLKKVLDLAIIDNSVVVGPGIGIDAAVLQQEDNLVLVASDPITGTSKDIGWLSVHINANDILASAGKPKWYVATLLFPEGVTEEVIIRTVEGINQGLNELNASLVAGHTEVTEKVKDVIISGTMIGEPIVRGTYISNTNAKPGDKILMTKGAGIEGTWIFAEEFSEKIGLDEETLNGIVELKKLISIYRDVYALLKVGIKNIHAMHDATEGGVIGAIYEIAEASKVGFRISYEDVIIREETRLIAGLFKIDPLELISSGTLIAVLAPEVAEEALKYLRQEKIDAAIIGEITKDTKERFVYKHGKVFRKIMEPPIDALWKLYGEN